jgi:ribulose-phosphate 3-epimerase
VDGGIDQTNIASVVRAGASMVVAGASIFHTPDPAASIDALRRLSQPS